MKRVVAVAAILISTVTAFAQPFRIVATPETQTITGASATIVVKAVPQPGFTATVFLSVTVPSLPQAQIAIHRDYINSPYSDSVVVTLTVTGPKTGGTHDVYIKGFNGPTSVYDTVSVTIPNRSPVWRVFSTSEIGTRYDVLNVPAVCTVDKRNGIAWLAGRDTLRSFDGEVWRKYLWPQGKAYDARDWPNGITIDSSGAVWTAFQHLIIKRADTAWIVLDDADATTGLTSSMLQSLGGSPNNTFSCIHTAPDGTIWISGLITIPGPTFKQSLAILKYDGLTWQAYNSTNAEVPMGNGRIISDTRGNLWVGGNAKGLIKFDRTYWTLYPSAPGVLSGGLPIAADRNGWIWVDGFNAVIQTNGDSSNFYWVGAHALPGPNHFQGNLISLGQSFDVDRDGDLWVGLKDYGLLRLIPGVGQYHYRIDNSGLPDNNVSFVSVDNAKHVWIRTQDGSLTILDGNVPPDSAFNIQLSVDEDNQRTSASLLSISPNPATSASIITVQLDRADRLRLRLVDPLGKEIILLLDEMKEPGEYHIPLATGELSAGMYFVQLLGNHVAATRPLIVVK